MASQVSLPAPDVQHDAFDFEICERMQHIGSGGRVVDDQEAVDRARK